MNIREAFSVTGIPQGEHGENGFYYEVGHTYHRLVERQWKIVGKVSRITVTDDLPGMYCNMERVRVYDGETLIFEAPLHNVEGVCYPAPEASHVE